MTKGDSSAPKLDSSPIFENIKIDSFDAAAAALIVAMDSSFANPPAQIKVAMTESTSAPLATTKRVAITNVRT